MRQRQGIFFILLLTVFIIPAACGKKGPPFLPEMEIPYRVELLTAEWKHEAFLLKGAVDDTLGREKNVSNIAGCRVYHACYSLDDPPCEECPINYGPFKEIKGEVISQGEFSCRVLAKKKNGIHFFKVRLVGPKGETGPFSERAKVIIADW